MPNSVLPVVVRRCGARRRPSRAGRHVGWHVLTTAATLTVSLALVPADGRARCRPKPPSRDPHRRAASPARQGVDRDPDPAAAAPGHAQHLPQRAQTGESTASGWWATPTRCATCRCGRTCRRTSPVDRTRSDGRSRAWRRDEVLVIEARGEPDAGTIGDIFVMRSKLLGAAGVVTDGALRDTPAIRTHRTCPCTTSSSHAATFGRLHMPLEHQVPIACAGVTVLPGRHPRRRRRGRRRAAGGTRRGGRGRRRAAGDRGGVGARTGRRRARARSARSPSPRSAGPSSRRGWPRASRLREEPGGRRQSACPVARSRANSFHHVNPIPAASRVGPLLVSSIIPARDPGGDRHPRRVEQPAREPLPPRRRDARSGRGRLGAHRQDDLLRPRPGAPRRHQRALGRALPRRRVPARRATPRSLPGGGQLRQSATSSPTSMDGA